MNSARTKFIMSRPKMILPLNAVVCTLAFGLALPFAIALFPQQSKVSDLYYITISEFVY